MSDECPHLGKTLRRLEDGTERIHHTRQSWSETPSTVKVDLSRSPCVMSYAQGYYKNRVVRFRKRLLTRDFKRDANPGLVGPRPPPVVALFESVWVV